MNTPTPKAYARLQRKASRLQQQVKDLQRSRDWHRDQALKHGWRPEKRCEHCDGTGDVHSVTGEWRGICTCEAGRAVAQKGSE